MNSDPNTSIDPRHPLPSIVLSNGRGHGMAKVEGGFPHSEIQGSKPVRGSPRLIAAYHVLHRLSAPRHPPDTLMTLDHSHHRCPLGEPESSLPIKRTSTLGLVAPTRPGPPSGWTQDLCFRTCPRRGAVKLPVTEPCLARSVSRRKGGRTESARRIGPLRQASLASRPDPRVGHIHSSRCRTTGSPEGERRSASKASDAPAGEAGGEFLWCGRAR